MSIPKTAIRKLFSPTMLSLAIVCLFPGIALAQLQANQGHWQIRQNIHQQDFTVVEFYDADYQKIYEETLDVYLQLNPYNIEIMNNLFIDFISQWGPANNLANSNGPKAPVVPLKHIIWKQSDRQLTGPHWEQ